MSYARFACGYEDPELNSDIYIYNDIQGGITLHVADHRLRNTTFRKNISSDIIHNIVLYTKHYVDDQLWNESAAYERIGLSYDGVTLHCLHPKDAIAFIKILIKEGYHIPTHIIPNIIKTHLIE